jgi:hypothetical protein
MPYISEWENNGIYCTFSGRVTGKELIQCNNDIYGDKRFDDIRYQLFDMLSVTEIAITGEDVLIVASCDKAAALTNPAVKCALIAHNEIIHAFSSLYQKGIEKSPWMGRSFYDVSKAREWLSSYT